MSACESCRGSGKNKRQEPCFWCNGSGAKCDACGEALTSQEAEDESGLCQECLAEEGGAE